MTESLDLAGERLRVMDQIAPYTTQDTRKPYTDQQVTEFQGALYWFISQRRTKLNEMFNPPPSPPPQP